MKKGQIIEGTIERVDFPSRGIISADGHEVTVRNSVPGQRVRCFLLKKRKKFEGRVIEILEKAPNEIDSPCPHFGECGGCIYQNLSYEDQLLLKEDQIKRLLCDHIPNFSEVYEGIIKSPLPEGYRNKMEYTFGDMEKGGKLTLGMHKRGSFYDIVPVPDCRIADPDFGKIISFAQDFFMESGIPFYHRMRHEGYLRHLLVRKGKNTKEILADIVMAPGYKDEAPLLREFNEGLMGLDLDGEIKGILHTKNASLADAVTDQGTEVLYGRDHIFDKVLGLTFRIGPFSFFQTNTPGAEKLYSKVREYADTRITLSGKKPVIFDLYCGTGTISQILSPYASKVYGIEIVEEAVLSAKENASVNGITNCEFICGDVTDVLDEVEHTPDFIVLDPPRAGIHPKALKKVILYGAANIIYVSCNPITFKRDLAEFTEGGYKVKKMALVDMFPATGNVESCVLLERVSNRNAY